MSDRPDYTESDVTQSEVVERLQVVAQKIDHLKRERQRLLGKLEPL